MTAAPVPTSDTVSSSSRSKSAVYGWVIAGLVLTIVLGALSLVVGTTSLMTSLRWLLSPDSQADTVLWQIRLPRTCGAWCAGALLGLGGAIAQGLFRNPLAEPYLLGTASGAALGVTLCLLSADASLLSLAWFGQLGVIGAAFIGACAAMLLTLTLARGVLQTANLLLAGVVVSFLLSAVTELLLLSAPNVWRTLQSFLLGTTGFLSWRSVVLLGISLVLTVIPALLLSRGLDALTLGEETAQSLGLSLPVLRVSFLAILSLVTAVSVGQVGVVGFVGLVAPHLVRQLMHVNHRGLLLMAPLMGGLLLQSADLLSRAIWSPMDLPVGAVTACIGGVYLVGLLWRRSHGR